MKYYRFVGKDDLWLGKFGKSQMTLIPNELLTQKEIDKISKNCPRLSIEKTFKVVDLPTNKTYSAFGARFENDTDHNSKLESLKLRTNEKLYVDSFDDAKCIGYGFLIRNMNTAYLNLYWYRSEDLAKQNLTIAELMSDEDNYDYDSFEDDVDTIVNTADGVVEEIDWRHDIDYFNKDGREICAYNSYTFDDDEYVELIDGENWVDLYF